MTKRDDIIPAPEPFQDDDNDGLVAVVVGIDGYREIPALRCATNDSVALSEALKKAWRNRRLSVDTLVWPEIPPGKDSQREIVADTWGVELPENATGVTRESILAKVRAASEKARPGDTFIFYFAGHGAIVDNEPCLVTIKDGVSGKGIEYVPVREVQDAVGENIRKRVMILDCCQTVSSKTGDFYKYLQNLSRDWSILTSCSPGEQSFEDRGGEKGEGDYLDQGLFTASLVEGISSRALAGHGGSITLLDLAGHVCKRVQVESEERILDEIMSRGDLPGGVLKPQHPVLMTCACAMGGPMQIIVAPEPAGSAQELRRSKPSKDFLTYWMKFTFGKWPIEIHHQFMVREGTMIIYGALMFYTILLNSSLGTAFTTFAIVVGFLSVFLWFVMLPFAVAANEDRWVEGGYVTAITFFVWHVVVFVAYLLMSNLPPPHTIPDPAGLNTVNLAIELFLILAVIVVCGCNATQAIISLAETVRKDERREIRQAIQIFRQFRKRVWNVDLYNYVAMVSARPVLYYVVLAIAVVLIIWNTLQSMESTNGLDGILLMRNAFALLLVAWLVFWYESAFKYIQKEVYKR